MKLKNPWVGYLDRGYGMIKNSIIARFRTLVPEHSDTSENNILIILISAFSGLVEQLNYYIDNLAQELYISTARRFSSMVKLTRLINYRIKSNISSYVDLRFTAVDQDNNPFSVLEDIVIPSGVILKTSNGDQFITTSSRVIYIGSSDVIIPARQRVLVEELEIGVTISADHQSFGLPKDYEDGTLAVKIGDDLYKLVDNFAFSGPYDKHVVVRVNEKKEPRMIFGDNINGFKPQQNQVVKATFYTTNGEEGNVRAGSVNSWLSTKLDIIDSGAQDLLVTNLLPSVAGQGVEGVENIRQKAPLSLQTLDRAITLEDYVKLAKLVPGVLESYPQVDDKSKFITIYITPTTRGIAPAGLIQDVKDYFEDRKPIGSTILIKPAGITDLILDTKVVTKVGANIATVEKKVKQNLVNKYGYNYSYINRPIRVSDIISLIDNTEGVDYLNMEGLRANPYPHIIRGENPLQWRVEVYGTEVEVGTWKIYMTSNNSLRVIKDGEHVAYISNIQNTDTGGWLLITSGIKINIWGQYSAGDGWYFKTYPINKDIEIDDLTVPVLDIKSIGLTINS